MIFLHVSDQTKYEKTNTKLGFRESLVEKYARKSEHRGVNDNLITCTPISTSTFISKQKTID